MFFNPHPLPTDIAFETIDAEVRQVGESPVWDAEHHRLLYASILDGEIHAISIASSKRVVYRFNSDVSAFGLCTSGKLVVALRAQVVLFNPQTGSMETLCEIKHAEGGMRLNDGKVGPDGSFWVGSMDGRSVKEPIAKLYRISPQGECTTAVDGLQISNGLAWSHDGKIMYHADSRGPWIDAWEFDPLNGSITNRRRFHNGDESSGRPDGGACDMQGNYWSAGPSAGRVNCFSPAGVLLGFITMPNFKPTMPCFGGLDMRTLFVTSLSANLPPELLSAHPLAGTLLAVNVNVEGVRIHHFRR